MLNLLRKTFEQIILFFYIRTDTLKVVNKNLEEDLEFARRTEEAMKRLERGEGIAMDFDDFLKEMKKW